ncbi:MAG: TonB-dependent receptor [Ignavibacteriales bacterium]|nr:TonB-dependent receptor [Ignavibacteriales bacterium]
MRKDSSFLVLTFLFTYLNLFSQQHDSGTLRGLVTDSTTSEVLAYGNVFIKEIGVGASTDARGYFLIPSIPANKNLTLVVSYVGYKTKTIPIAIAKNKVTQYNIKLMPSSVELQTIEKIGERVVEKNETDISLQRIIVRDLEALPQGVETDVFRSLQYLPGVQSTGDVSARFYVRGGASNQNLILIEGITLYSPFHSLGLFSVIDPDMINNVEFYKGGFTAEYGGRLSSVVKTMTKDGNKNNYAAKASASFLTGKLLLEGPIPHGSFILTGRKSYSNQIIKKFLNEQNTPIDFYDFSFKTNYSNYDFMEGAKFTFNGFFSGDNIANSNPTIEDFKWSNSLLGFKWFQVGDSPLFYELSLSLSKFDGEVVPKLSDAKQSLNSVEDITAFFDLTYMFDNKDEIGVGFHIKNIRTDLYIENALGIQTNLGTSAANISLYAKYKLLQFDFIGIDLGTRINLATLSSNKGTADLEPRISLVLRPFEVITLKGAFGIYQQELITVTDENEVINLYEPWVVSPEYITPSKATHYILGFDLDIINGFTFSVEGYYKKINNLVLVNNNKASKSDDDFLTGEGESYGTELTAKINTSIFNFTAAYTHAYAYKVVDEKRYYPRYDIRNTLNLILEFNLGDGWSTSAVWVYNSGLPFTQIVGYYDKYYLDNIFAPWYQYDPRRPFTMIGVQNLARLPDYHRLDLSLTKKLNLGFVKAEIDASIINVYDRKNIFYFTRETGKRVNMLPFMPTVTFKVEI